jgi:hypothetical protein
VLWQDNVSEVQAASIFRVKIEAEEFDRKFLEAFTTGVAHFGISCDN